ncbi:hypothetical protein HAX54_036707 [Datura stramonium]|uniref:Uncharacterized protein n=1 Tax=Datura stramonium TaxID=4076 RepID=A0ABS8VIJ8_DATST|nr:hypothetical protein [Datura stramonium]
MAKYPPPYAQRLEGRSAAPISTTPCHVANIARRVNPSSHQVQPPPGLHMKWVLLIPIPLLTQGVRQSQQLIDYGRTNPKARCMSKAPPPNLASSPHLPQGKEPGPPFLYAIYDKVLAEYKSL